MLERLMSSSVDRETIIQKTNTTHISKRLELRVHTEINLG